MSIDTPAIPKSWVRDDILAETNGAKPLNHKPTVVAPDDIKEQEHENE